MRTDAPTLLKEARGVLKNALTTYSGDPVHVTIFCLRRCVGWNETQTLLSRTGRRVKAEKLKRICRAVRRHLKDELRIYLSS